MKFLKVLIIFLVFGLNVYADSIYYLIKIPNLEMINVNTGNQIKTFKTKKYFKVGINDNSVECYSSSDTLLKNRYNIIRENLSVYNDDFLSKINLKFVVLCEDLEVASIPALGVPNHSLKTIIININTDEYKLSRVIHHEIFHIINDQYKELFNYNKWRDLNSKDFRYQNCSTCTDKFGMDLLKVKEGFLSEYSQSTIGEDMAEIYSFLMTKNIELKKVVQKDNILKKKINFIKSNILLIDKSFKFN